MARIAARLRGESPCPGKLSRLALSLSLCYLALMLAAPALEFYGHRRVGKYSAEDSLRREARGSGVRMAAAALGSRAHSQNCVPVERSSERLMSGGAVPVEAPGACTAAMMRNSRAPSSRPVP